MAKNQKVVIEFSEDLEDTVNEFKNQLSEKLGDKKSILSTKIIYPPSYVNTLNIVSNIIFFAVSIIGILMKPNIQGPLDPYVSPEMKELFTKIKLPIMLCMFVLRILCTNWMQLQHFEILYSENDEPFTPIYSSSKNKEEEVDNKVLIEKVMKRVNPTVVVVDEEKEEEIKEEVTESEVTEVEKQD